MTPEWASIEIIEAAGGADGVAAGHDPSARQGCRSCPETERGGRHLLSLRATGKGSWKLDQTATRRLNLSPDSPRSSGACVGLTNLLELAPRGLPENPRMAHPHPRLHPRSGGQRGSPGRRRAFLGSGLLLEAILGERHLRHWVGTSVGHHLTGRYHQGLGAAMQDVMLRRYPLECTLVLGHCLEKDTLEFYRQSGRVGVGVTK